ncbi:MAG: Crp/Fnr family transcriptional regulator [Acidobacteriota bacterium]
MTYLHPHMNSGCKNCSDRSLRVLCDLSGQARSDFEALGMQMRLPKRSVIFQEDDICDAATIICMGQVKLSCTSREGKTHILRIAVPGDLLGLGAAISGTHYELTAETIEPCVVKKIRRSELLAFLERYGQASMLAAKALSEEYKSAFFDARRLALSGSTAGRLAGVLLDWGRSAAGRNGTDMRFTMALTHEELANLAGTSRETVTRALGRFQKEGLIEIHGSSFRVLSPLGLESLAT